MELFDLILLLWRRKGIILITSIGLAIITFIVCLCLPQIYEAKARVIINDGEGGFSFSSTIFASLGGAVAGQIGDYVEIAKSNSLISETAKELGLPYELGTKDFEKMKKGFSVFSVPTANIMEIRFESRNPQTAMDFVNLLVSKCQQKTTNSKRKSTSTSLQVIQEEIARESEILEKAENDLEQYKKETKIVAPTQHAGFILQRLTSLQQQEASLELAITEAKARYASLSAELNDQDAEITINQVVSRNPILTQMQQTLANKEIALGGLLEVYTEEHPQVIALKSEIEQLKVALANQAEVVVSTQTLGTSPIYSQLLSQLVAISVEIDAKESSLRTLRSGISEIEKGLEELPATERQLLELTRNKTVAEGILAMLLQKEAEYRVQDEMEQGPIEILDAAFLPKRAVKPRRMLNAAAAGFLGFILSAGYVLIDNALFERKRRSNLSEAV